MSPAIPLFLLLLYAPKLIVSFCLNLRFKKVEDCREEDLPFVSVLIPARNEALNISKCLKTLLALDYPADRLEILVGDDQSTDDTDKIVTEIMAGNELLRLIKIEPNYHGLIARSNVLAQLAKQANGEYLIFLDADMWVHPGWLKKMVAPTRKGYQVVSGYTGVKGKGWLSGMQQLDWYNILAWLKAAADLGQQGTALGNNMLVSRRVYEKVGGYEAIGPTYTEDNDLTMAIRNRGYDLFQVAEVEHATTLPVLDIQHLIKQRRRWMVGAFQQPAFKLVLVLLSRLFVLVALVLSIWSYDLALVVIVHNVLLDLVNTLTMWFRSGIRTNIFYALVAPVFNSLLDSFTLLSYPFNKKVVWKGRKL